MKILQLRNILLGCVLGGFLSLLATPLSYASDEAVYKEAKSLIKKGLASDVGFEIVESLTTEIGPRLAGSEAEARARSWGEGKFRELGFSNIRTEPFLVKHWERKFEQAQIISPYPQNLVITALGGSISTPPDGVTGEVVSFPTLQDLKDAPEKGLEGKIVFVDEYMTRTQGGSGYGIAVRKRSGAANEAGKRGAALRP